MAKLRHAKMFTKLDLCWGYNNVRIKEGDEWKTAFRTKDLIDVTVVIYLDDILIFSEDPKKHPEHVREVLLRLMKNQLFCKLSNVTSTSPQSITLALSYPLQASPWTRRRLRPLHHGPTENSQAGPGLPRFRGSPPPQSHKKEIPWSWESQEEEAFQELKSLVTQTDASGVAMGAILSQRGEDNRLHPIAYMSKSFSGAEANYDTHNKELLAIIKALEEWRIFWKQRTNRNLEYWMQARTFNRQHARWRVFLSDFNFEIHYCPGKQSGKPDALSRRSDYTDTPGTRGYATSQVKGGPIPRAIIQFLTEDADNAPPSIRKAYQDYDWEEDLLWYRGKLVVPDSEPLKEQLLREFHDSPLAGHPGQQRTLELISRNYWWPGMKSSAKEWVECCPVCQANRRAHAQSSP
ncbi:Retrotransposable element Tf2 protein [Rhizoctonia solani]|uniref:Retrotransposable element Tf2 protein n=1 Tax=Rhizoctonia solani TaxID=456999 RepID=A0A8H8P2H9_9AGAM|nr:Retrotransposable element Tf2 protein [Rhizoctonia solani]QRW23107.1 Retrotransposable element Tf2 protein [Rhizoctonia solani]